ncbi:linear amide C-N hydrolase [Kaistia geumhonensis]|uniref:Penicillin V acylase-like amidase (Ntn superfamily) n=1 Tax=Kaistia geumhonensis TaxID=410839 RepID=A0ABU0M7P0_9HYPH|nr:linear amide C-N hydrolase [Kaistia geumhonensis]MCX5477994.1 linear amide C-N hydrolase [Kaistia geumhonensis]MDQ0516793.1 penicillin V acylase-like amidase (Ntn superfamily) [Kaistia geumhonensis]
MCTSLGYRDAAGKAYYGRTLELTTDLPYQVTFFPAGFESVSEVEGHPKLTLTSRHDVIAVTMPYRLPTAEAPLGLADLKVLEGLNDKGLTFSLLSYPESGGSQKPVEMTKAVLSASDLGLWALGQFATAAEVKAALEAQPVMLQPLALLGGVVSPFHYVVHDATGASVVVEFDHGAMTVYDNPVGVMTNGPKFDWHLTNLSNYSFLTNVDKSAGAFGGLKVRQPDSGIATQGLPSSSTSVGRFVRAAYYAEFTEKAATPDLAVQTLAHILNTFDRPRGASIDYPDGSGGHLEVEGLAETGNTPYATEFTCWTSLSDLDRRRFFVRDYRALNYVGFDLAAIAAGKRPASMPLAHFAAGGDDGSAQLIGKAG